MRAADWWRLGAPHIPEHAPMDKPMAFQIRVCANTFQPLMRPVAPFGEHDSKGILSRQLLAGPSVHPPDLPQGPTPSEKDAPGPPLATRSSLLDLLRNACIPSFPYAKMS